jgi:hypothetical protein
LYHRETADGRLQTAAEGEEDGSKKGGKIAGIFFLPSAVVNEKTGGNAPPALFYSSQGEHAPFHRETHSDRYYTTKIVSEKRGRERREFTRRSLLLPSAV